MCVRRGTVAARSLRVGVGRRAGVRRASAVQVGGLQLGRALSGATTGQVIKTTRACAAVTKKASLLGGLDAVFAKAEACTHTPAHTDKHTHISIDTSARACVCL
mmetsp:Transcript_68258/g.142232  ORF Transcript_68258/g.142232 Transcript_68258/m.142232 type:complete len:104 (-) Transcript_68258:1506-1817(-)